VGKTDDEIVGADQARRLNALKRRVLETGTGARQEVVIPHNGKKYSFEVAIEPLFDSQGHVMGITGAAMDVARLRELADSLEEAKDKLVQEKQYLENEIKADLGFENIIGQSTSLQEVLKQVRVVAPTDSTVLLLGETGTGKDLIARTIHNLSPRAGRPFIEVNCAALPENLLESELFGYESGAFTGAKDRKIGLFEAASAGTVFLDEMGEIAPALQAKLLRVLEDKKIRRLGGTQLHEIDVRIIAATNQDLREAIKAKRFREDLFYRLHIVPIHLPPLRERSEDVIALSKYFLSEYAKKFSRSFKGLGRDSQALLLAYPWPGNVRELRHVIERICIMHDAQMLLPEHLPKEHTLDSFDSAAPTIPFYFPVPPEGLNLDKMVDLFTLHLIKKVMHMADGNISQAAKLLGIPRGTLRYKLDKYLADDDQNVQSDNSGTPGA